jgi:PAS domain S-box-containing protein
VTAVSITVIIMSFSIFVLTVLADKKIRKMNKDLYDSGELFHTLGTNVDDIFIICNRNSHKFDYISPNFEKIIGLKQEVLYQDYSVLLDYVPEPERKKFIEILSAPMYSDTKQIEFQLDPLKTGRNHWLFVRIYPDCNQEKNRYVICISDITKEKEAQLLLNDTMYNLKRANEAKKEFLSHISHEIKTPINAIMGMTQIAQNNIENKEKVISCLNKIDFASGRLLEMINNILDMSKIDSDKLVLVNKPFRVNELLNELEALLSNQAEIQGKDFSLVINGSNDYSVISDSTRLYQILANCVSNALKFTPPGGSIRLEVSEVEKNEDIVKLRFIISDTGIGMSEEFLERIFIPFDQEDSNLIKNYGGTGLGMPIAKNLVQLMGGEISVNSAVGVGTTFHIHFPLVKMQAEQSEA